jgi:hypothetical protein
VKVIELISWSLRLLGVLDAEEAPSAESAAIAISALNAMCTRWEANGLAFGWTAVASAQDDLPASPELHECLAYNLAVRLAPQYGKQLDGLILSVAENRLTDLRRDVAVAHPIEPIIEVPTPQNSSRDAARLGWPGSWYGES